MHRTILIGDIRNDIDEMHLTRCIAELCELLGRHSSTMGVCFRTTDQDTLARVRSIQSPECVAAITGEVVYIIESAGLYSSANVVLLCDNDHVFAEVARREAHHAVWGHRMARWLSCTDRPTST